METEMILSGAFDVLLNIGLLCLAWLALTCRDLFKAIVLFISFGLLMALVWVRLGAPDVALAEAAIGAGLTGALLLAALFKLQSSVSNQDTLQRSEQNQTKGWLFVWFAAVTVLLILVGLGSVIVSLPPFAVGLSKEVAENLEISGVGNPVTAVLLNFRGYDTLLEMFVLLVALMGVWALSGTALWRETAPGPILDVFSRLLVPVLILVAAYLLWVGADAPGGAFQAGSVLGAAGVLLVLAGWRLRKDITPWPLQLLVVVGPGAFVTVALYTILIEGQFLKYPPTQAGIIILFLEITATLSIGATLAALFLGDRPWGQKSQ